MSALHPLLARLVDDFSLPLLTGPHDLDAFCDVPGDAVLLCGGDPIKYPECLDVAVVLPELLRAFPGQFRAALVGRELEPAAQARFGFNRWPSLVFLRDGAYVGTISGVQDWAVFLERIEALLAAPATRAPSVGIAVATPLAACH